MASVGLHRGSSWFLTGAGLSGLAGLLHVGVIIGGPDWYRFFGAPEAYAQAAAAGGIMPALVTSGIAGVLFVWAAFALSGGGYIVRFPLLRAALVAITAVYLLRGAVLIPAILFIPYPEGAFDYWSSAIVLIYGLVHLAGLVLAWRSLRPQRKDDQ